MRVATYSARFLSPRNARIDKRTAGVTNIQNHNTRKSLAKRYTSGVSTGIGLPDSRSTGIPACVSFVQKQHRQECLCYRTVAVLIAVAFCGLQGSEPAGSVYLSRRAELRKALPNGIGVLFGRTEGDSDDLRSGFYQEPNFYYLTGWNQPGAILVLEPAGEMIFLPAKDLEAEKWTG